MKTSYSWTEIKSLADHDSLIILRVRKEPTIWFITKACVIERCGSLGVQVFIPDEEITRYYFYREIVEVICLDSLKFLVEKLFHQVISDRLAQTFEPLNRHAYVIEATKVKLHMLALAQQAMLYRVKFDNDWLDNDYHCTESPPAVKFVPFNMGLKFSYPHDEKELCADGKVVALSLAQRTLDIELTKGGRITIFSRQLKSIAYVESQLTVLANDLYYRSSSKPQPTNWTNLSVFDQIVWFSYAAQYREAYNE